MTLHFQEMESFSAVMVEAMGEVRRRLAETRSALAVITHERRERLEGPAARKLR